MSAPTAVEYVSYADATGYGQAAVGYVRLLVDAGLHVHWKPYLNDALWNGRIGPAHDVAELSRGRAALMARGQSASGNGLTALVEATSRPVAPELRILHMLPLFWPMNMALAPGVAHAGMTVWETDRLPAKWLPALGAVSHLMVPSEHNAQILSDARADGAALPGVSVVPHLCRSAPHLPSQVRLAALAKWLRIGPADTVFYSINAWDPRKRLGALISGFARSFSEEDPAVLVVKTNRRTWFDDPMSPPGDRDVQNTVAAILAKAAADTGRPPARVAVIADDEISDSLIDGLHAISHCFVTLSRCEGFGLGCFDAATYGRPVIAVGYGGPLDYLGAAWPGRIGHHMVRCDAPPGFGSFDPGQSWPEPHDAEAFALMRAFLQDERPFREAAAAGALSIKERFGAGVIGKRLLAALSLQPGERAV